MGESFQDYSWIQDCEADFEKSASKSWIKQNGSHLNLKLIIFVGILQVSRFDF